MNIGNFEKIRMMAQNAAEEYFDPGEPMGIVILVRDGTKDRKEWRVPGAGVPFRDSWEEGGQRFYGPEMVVVPAGSFLMGTASDKATEKGFEWETPQHEVVIRKPFAVGRFAVTFDEWEIAMADGFERADQGWGGGDRPVINVGWDEAQAYVAWLRDKSGKDYRLLSEAEWEYAARAGSTASFWWGASINPDQANYDSNNVFGGGKKGEFREQTVPVKSFRPNPWGLYQVHGNVSEWCEDVWRDNYNGAPADGTAWLTGGDGECRVLRGGCWYDEPCDLRSAARRGELAIYRGSGCGFRLARTL